MIDVSIIIVNWNTSELLKNCIDSIHKAGNLSSFEIIVIDNGSTDDSIKLSRKLESSGLIQKFIANNANLGFSKANNAGIREAKGEYILLLNSDTEVKKGAIDSLINFAKSDPQIGVVGAQLLNADGTIQPSCFRFPTLINAIRQYWLGERGLYDKYYPKSEKPTQVDIVVGAAFLITPQAIKKVGKLNEKYFFFFEDLDYCRAVKKAGLLTYYLPTSHVVHFHGSTLRKIVSDDNAWKNLIPGSKLYHGEVMHYLITFVMWTGQKWQKFFKNTQ